MARYFKPNNSRILYLNTNFNCIKSNSITITKTGNGTGYTSTPSIVITPAAGDLGSGASANVGAPVSGVLSGALTMINNGFGYNKLPTATTEGGGDPGRITSLTITNGGSGYKSAPTISATGGGGTGFSAVGIITNGVLTGFQIITRSIGGYTSTPTIVVSGGGSPGVITSINITNGGSGYTTAPTVGFTGGGGTNAAATATISGGKVSSITITNGGSNYTSAPTITFTGGGGSGASATPVANYGTTATLTPVLNPGTQAVFTVAFTRTFNYSWEIPPIEINDLGKLSVVHLLGTGATATTPYTFRIRDLFYDNTNTYMSDYGDPIIMLTQQTNVACYGSVGNTIYNVVLSPQVIRRILITVDDSFSTKGAGVLNAFNFIIVLEIEEFDVALTRIDNPYEEAKSKLKPY